MPVTALSARFHHYSPRIVCVATALDSRRCSGGQLAIELLPLVITYNGEGIRQVIDEHGRTPVIYLGDDVRDTDVFRMLRACARTERAQHSG
jgi:trehalose-6-phosphatase